MLFAFQNAVEQALGLLLHGEDVGTDFGEGAQGLGLVEVACEGDFIADFGGVGLEPSVGRVGEDLAAEEGFDSARLQERDGIKVARRTDNKYREELKIPPASRRRRR